MGVGRSGYTAIYRSKNVMELKSTTLQPDNQVKHSQGVSHVQLDSRVCISSDDEQVVTYTCQEENDADRTNKQDSDSGRCTPQEIEIFRTGSPSVRFEEILIDVINSTTIHVDWCPVVNNEDLVGYKIRYAIKDNPSYNEVFVTAGISSYTISGLKPNTEYIASVCAIDEKENIIQQCGWASQRTDETGERKRPHSSPYVAVIVGVVLLTTAFVVPLTILVVHKYYRNNRYGAPTLTAVAALLLLLVAVVVPVTLLFVRNCGQCEPPSDREKSPSVQVKEMNEHALQETDNKDNPNTEYGKPYVQGQRVTQRVFSRQHLLRHKGNLPCYKVQC